MRKNLVRVGAIAAGLALLAAACGDDDDDSSSGAATTAAGAATTAAGAATTAAGGAATTAAGGGVTCDEPHDRQLPGPDRRRTPASASRSRTAPSSPSTSSTRPTPTARSSSSRRTRRARPTRPPASPRSSSTRPTSSAWSARPSRVSPRTPDPTFAGGRPADHHALGHRRRPVRERLGHLPPPAGQRRRAGRRHRPVHRGHLEAHQGGRHRRRLRPTARAWATSCAPSSAPRWRSAT